MKKKTGRYCMRTVVTFVSKTPVPVCGLALAFASLDMFLSQNYKFYTFSICALISVILIVLFTLRAVLDIDGLRKELNSPVVFGVLPTYCMTLMLLSSYAYKYIGQMAVLIWASAVVLSFVMMFFFVKKFVLGLDIKNVFPSWFVMFIGFIAASVTSPIFGVTAIGKVILFAGLIMYFIITPIILYRVVVIRGIPEPAVPNIAIFAAPMNLCIVGYFMAFGADVNGTAVAVMSAIGIVSYAAVLVCLPFLLRIKFHPSYAAFTFPLVISMVSIRRLGVFYGVSNNGVFSAFQTLTVIIAVLMVAYVFIRFLIMFCGTARNLKGCTDVMNTP